MIYQLLFPSGRALDLNSDLRLQFVDLLTRGYRSMKQFPVGMHTFSTSGIASGWHDALLDVREDGTAVAYILTVNFPQVTTLKVSGGQLKNVSVPRGTIRLPEDEGAILSIVEVTPEERRVFSVILYLPFEV